MPSRSPEEVLVHRIADKSLKLLRSEFLKSVTDISNLIPEESVEHLLSLNMMDAIFTVIPFDMWGPVISGNMFNRLRDITREAVDSTFIQKADFDTSPKDPDVLAHLNRVIADLVTEITEEHKKVIRDVIIKSSTGTVSDREIIDTIKRVTGLRSDQLLAADNFRQRMLEKGKSPSEVERMAKSFEKRMLGKRADMIARTESMNAANEGQQIGWDKASRAGAFDRSRASLEWVTAMDDLVCPTCNSMNGVKRPYTGSWRVEIRRPIVIKGSVRGSKSTGRILEVKIPNRVHPNCRCVAKLIT